MIVAIAAGLPCIVNESKNYETLAKLFSLDYSIVNDDASLRYALNYLNNIENRKEYLKDIQPYVLNNFSSKIISKKLLQLIENYREK